MEKKYDLIFAGPACIDDNTDYTGETIHSQGGAVYFAVFAAKAAGAKVLAALKMDPADAPELIPDFGDIPTLVLNSRETTRMVNVYHDATREKRDASVGGQSDSLRADELPVADAGLIHLGGLLYGDYPDELLDDLHRQGARVSADMQGFLRHNENGSLTYHDWPEKKKYLPYFTYLKVDANEAQIMTGTDDRRAAAKQLKDWGAGEVLLSYNEEMLVYDGREYYTCPVKARNLSGRTGRGDSTFASYLTKREHGASVPEALLYATALVSLKMETPGPFKGTDADVQAYIREFYC